jgi:F-type H+-transporting ATPase subunit a
VTTMTRKPRRFGFKRWIVLGLIVVGAVLAWGVGSVFTPISPAVVIPGEPIWPTLPHPPAFTITNTMVGTLLADVILILIAFGAYRFVRSGQMVPRGFYNFFEAIVEWLWNATEAASGRWARRIFPWVATIFLLVLTANWVKLTPIFESWGYLAEAHGNIQGYEPVAIIPGALYVIDGSHPVDHDDEEHSSLATGGIAAAELPGVAAVPQQEAPCHACEVVPIFRGAATDLNFTFSLAIIAVAMTQVFGFWALGPGYLVRYFNFGALFSKPGMGVIDFSVGLLELISEGSKLLSFSFRLFGNIFAGTLLLSILGTLTVVVVPVGLFIFELFFGSIQAYVFAMLALVFMSQATVSHHGDGHADEPHAAAGHH